MQTRRHDIDAMRVIAIGLLLVYHTAISFQPWGAMIGFLVAPRSWPEIWPAMSMLNVWRIPLLFFVSGMGLQMAMGRNTTKQVWMERCKRIGIPLLLGSFVVVPLQTMVILRYYQQPIAYIPGMAHLWFLGNILVYALVLSLIVHLLPAFFRSFFHRISSGLAGAIILLLLIMMALALESFILDPRPFELYAFTLHGWVIGWIAFAGGYMMMAAGNKLWLVLRKSKWLLLATAFTLFLKRVYPSPMVAEGLWLSLESTLWIFGFFGLCNTFLNKPIPFIAQWKEAAYPLYILHMLFLHVGSVILFPLQLPAALGFGLLLSFVLVGSLLVYQFMVRRYQWMRFLFGLRTSDRR